MSDMYTPDPAETYGARPGDIVHVRGSSTYARLIRACIPGWGNHDATLVWHEGAWKVAEAELRPGFVALPWSEYWRMIQDGTLAVVIMRQAGIPREWSDGIAEAAVWMLGQHPRYDWRAIWSILVRMSWRSASSRGRDWEWYCTEACMTQARMAESQLGLTPGTLDAWTTSAERKQGIRNLPTPYTTERRHAQGLIQLVAAIPSPGHPTYRAPEL